MQNEEAQERRKATHCLWTLAEDLKVALASSPKVTAMTEAGNLLNGVEEAFHLGDKDGWGNEIEISRK